MTTRTKLTVCAIGAVMLIGLIAGWPQRKGNDAPPRDATASSTSVATSASTTSRVIDGGDQALRNLAALLEGGAGGEVRLAAKWGAGQGELGRERPQEGNPEGPMSFAFAGDDMFVLDQVNGRLSKFDKKGKLQRTIDTKSTTIQDLTVAKDGSVIALDRLADKTISVYDANGKKTGEHPLSGGKVGETGLVTGVFSDGKDIYVEKEHGALVHVGTTDGKAADDTKELAGRPSKDGALLLTAVIAAPREGRLVLNAIDRTTGSLRFARQINVPRPAKSIVLLDSDAKGTIYLGAACGPSDNVAEIACLDSKDGHVLGRVDVPLSTLPEETFRDFVVTDDGSIVYALRTEDGVEYRAVRCP